MLTKQDLLNLLNSMESLPNDAPLLVDTAYGIMSVSKIELCKYEPSTRYGMYWKYAPAYPCTEGEDVYYPYASAIQIHLGDKL